jgi:hypothetical protein
MRLLLAEFHRLFARDILKVVGLIAVGGAVLGGIGAYISTSPVAPATAAELDRELTRQSEVIEDRIRECMQPRELEESEIPPDLSEEFRQQIIEERQRARSRRECLIQSIPNTGSRDLRLSLVGALPFSLLTIAAPLALLGFVVGASFIGAEWSAGTMTTALTWEPRRLRLLLVKTLAVVIVVAVGYVLAEAAMAVSLLPAAMLRGTTAGIGGWWWGLIADITWRGSALAIITTLLGFSMALLVRHTVAVVGAAFGYLVIVENVLRNLTDDLHGWLITSNALIVVFGYDPSMELPERTPETSLSILALYAAVIFLAGAAIFWRRDVHASGD